MITTHLRNLLTAVICIFAGATAQAQLVFQAWPLRLILMPLL